MSKWQGTPVPNTGYVDKVYFNTALSIEEVVSILDTISYNEEIGMEVILGSELDENGNSNIIFISKTNNVWTIMVNFGDTLQEILFVTSDDFDLGYVGWNPNITYPLAVNFNAVNELDGIAFGSQNNLLSFLFSTTPFVEVQEKVTLNGFLKNIADAIRSKKGTTDKINASNFASEIAGITGGDGGIIEVDELPTNPEENVLYQVNKASDIDVYIKTGEALPSTLEVAIKSLGATPNLTYYVVDSLPETPNISDLQTFNPAYVYIYNDIAYTYGNAGYGNMWLEVKDLISSITNIPHEDKGYVENRHEISGDVYGIYVTYKKIKGILYNNNTSLKIKDNSGWVDYRELYFNIMNIYNFDYFDANLTQLTLGSINYWNCSSISLPNVLHINPSAIMYCYDLKSVKLDNAKFIDVESISHCQSLESIYFGNIEEINSNFASNHSLKAVIINQNNFVCDLSKGSFTGVDYYTFFKSCYRILGKQDETFNPNGLKDGYIYVPDSLVEQYKVAENWCDFASQIKPLSELPQEYKDLYGI